jgi:hypothetical protein
MSTGQKQKEGPGLRVRDLQEGGDVIPSQSKRDRNTPRVFRVLGLFPRRQDQIHVPGLVLSHCNVNPFCSRCMT